jgi:hypothetical protein
MQRTAVRAVIPREYSPAGTGLDDHHQALRRYLECPALLFVD